MSLRKRNVILNMANLYVIDSPQPSSINYWWNIGSLLALCLIIQIVTGITLTMHYTSHASMAFDSIEHIMRDVNYGWLIRYLHANGASLFFILIYLHIGRNIYYGSYKSPRVLAWSIGVIIFLLLIITAFMGYVLVYGQMSLWGATVICNLLSAIPWLGNDIVEFLWGGFSVGNATLQRFFALHYLMPFILAIFALLHLIALHTAGSSNPLGITSNVDKLSMHPYYIFKDIITILLFILIMIILVSYYPNLLGHPDNYIPANPMVTPASIVPEWYLLPFYAILRAIPNKLGGVLAMIFAILILLILPLVDKSIIRGNSFKPISKLFMIIFICNFILLGVLGQVHIEPPFILLGQICTLIYFSYFLIIMPLISMIENVLYYVGTKSSINKLN